MSRRDEASARLADKLSAFSGPGAVDDTVRLALIGDNIAASRSPRLHRLAARLCGLRVDYELVMPARLDSTFDEVFDRCAAHGLRGVNVTYPYKERVAARTRTADPRLRSIGGINTVVFEAHGAVGYNTDYSGFIAAWHRNMKRRCPGTVCLLGAGGVGKAVAFALVELGMRDLRVFDRDRGRADALAGALAVTAAHVHVEVSSDAAHAARRVDGLVNCTPVGMVGIGGTVLEREAMHGASWAFDAVYTPVDTEFLRNAAAAGLEILTGYELFFYQGIDAFERFTGHRPDEGALRTALQADKNAGSHETCTGNDSVDVT